MSSYSLLNFTSFPSCLSCLPCYEECNQCCEGVEGFFESFLDFSISKILCWNVDENVQPGKCLSLTPYDCCFDHECCY